MKPTFLPSEGFEMLCDRIARRQAQYGLGLICSGLMLERAPRIDIRKDCIDQAFRCCIAAWPRIRTPFEMRRMYLSEAAERSNIPEEHASSWKKPCKANADSACVVQWP